MKEPKDLTNELKVIGVTLLSAEQADWITYSGSTSAPWLIRSSAHNLGNYDERYVMDMTCSGWSVAAWRVDEPLCVRPVLISPNLNSLDIGDYRDENDRRIFRYKGLEWKLAYFKENGYGIAFYVDVLKDESGKNIKVPFRDCDLTISKKEAIAPDGKPIAWSDLPNFSHSTVKQFLDKWAKGNGIINQPFAGVPYNATNGNVIEDIFPNASSEIVWEKNLVQVSFGTKSPASFSTDWWNAPYVGRR